MVASSNRWLVLPALVLSVILWLAVSSVTANAVHVLAKSNFSFRSYGSVSVWLVAGALSWSLIIGYLLLLATSVTAKNLIWGACAVGFWSVFLILLTAVGDEFLGSLDRAAIIVWLLEIAGALLLVRATSRLTSADIGPHTVLWDMLATLTWLIAAKALLLCLSPGVVIRM